MIALVTLGACCSTTAAATAGVGLVAQASGSSLNNLLLNNWYLDLFQVVVVFVALLAQEMVLRVYGGLFGLETTGGSPHSTAAEPPRVTAWSIGGGALRIALLLAGVTWSLAMFAEWTTVSPLTASATLWFQWVFQHQLIAVIAVLLALFPSAVARGIARPNPGRLTTVLRVSLLVAGLSLATWVPAAVAARGVGFRQRAFWGLGPPVLVGRRRTGLLTRDRPLRPLGVSVPPARGVRGRARGRAGSDSARDSLEHGRSELGADHDARSCRVFRGPRERPFACHHLLRWPSDRRFGLTGGRARPPGPMTANSRLRETGMLAASFILWPIAITMALVTAYLIKWAAETRTPLRAATVVFLLMMMVGMIGGAAIYFLHPSGTSLVEGFWVASALMSVSVVAVFLTFLEEARLRLASGEQYAPPPLRAKRTFVVSVIGLVLLNELLMGWTFSTAAGAPLTAAGAGGLGVVSLLAQVVASPWFLFTMSIEMAVTTFVLRSRITPALYRVLLVQSLIMFLSPTALAGGSWVALSIYVSSAAMIGLIIYLMEFIYRHRQLDPGFSHYVVALLAIFSVMMAGQFLWLYYGGWPVVFALSIVAEMVLFFAAVVEVPTGSGRRWRNHGN